MQKGKNATHTKVVAPFKWHQQSVLQFFNTLAHEIAIFHPTAEYEKWYSVRYSDIEYLVCCCCNLVVLRIGSDIIWDQRLSLFRVVLDSSLTFMGIIKPLYSHILNCH